MLNRLISLLIMQVLV